MTAAGPKSTWRPEWDDELRELFAQERGNAEMARHFGYASVGPIRANLRRLGCWLENDPNWLRTFRNEREIAALAEYDRRKAAGEDVRIFWAWSEYRVATPQEAPHAKFRRR